MTTISEHTPKEITKAVIGFQDKIGLDIHYINIQMRVMQRYFLCNERFHATPSEDRMEELQTLFDVVQKQLAAVEFKINSFDIKASKSEGMKFDFTELTALIGKKPGTLDALAKATGLRTDELKAILETGDGFCIDEIHTIAELLEIPAIEFQRYFFVEAT